MKQKILVFLTAAFLVALCLSFAACGKSYTVTFFTDGGSTVASQQVKEGETAEKPETDPVREGYAFAGWYKDPSTEEKYSFDTPVTENITIYAKWATEYRITFVSGNGDENKTVSFYGSGAADLSPSPVRDGYHLLGWFDAEEGGNEVDLDAVASDVTVYAHWAKYYTVTYETGEGEALENDVFYEGQRLTLPKAERQGFVFVGWCTDGELNEPFSSETMPPNDITLYAEFLLSPDADDTYRYIPVGNESYSIAIKDADATGTLVLPSEHFGFPVVSIHNNGFLNSAASKFVIPESITSIGDNAFAGSAVTEFELPDSVLSVGSNVLQGCDQLATLKLAYCGPDRDHATYGLEYLFGDDGAPVSLREVALYYAQEIPLGFMARTEFSGSLVEKVTVPFLGQYPDESGNLMFGWIFGSDTHDYYGLLVPASIREVTVLGGTRVVRNCFGSMFHLTKVTLPDTLTTIETYAFNQCTSLTDIYLPEGLLSIGDYAFQRCDSWTPVLPSTVESLGKLCLPLNDSITNFELPKNLVTLSAPIFAEMTNLAQLTVAQDAPNFTVGADGALYSKDGSILYVYPRAKDAGAYVVPASVTQVKDYAFYYLETLTGFDFTNVTAIGEYAFFHTGLTSVTLSVAETVGALSFCATPMTSLYVCASVTSIGQRAFSSNTQLTDITIAEGEHEMTFGYASNLSDSEWISASVLSSGIFAYNTALKSIVFPSNWTTIPSGVVQGCTALTEIEIKGTLKFIGNSAFADTGLRSIEVTMADDGLIRVSAFVSEALKSVFLTNPNPPALYGLTVFNTSTSIIVPEGAVDAYKDAEDWEKYADNISDTLLIGEFVINASGVLTAYNGESAEVVLPDEVRSIGANVFSGMSFITSVTLNEGLENIDANAFKNCTGLTEIVFPASLKTFYGMTTASGTLSAFTGCANLQKITFLNETTIPAFGWYEFPSKPIVIVKPTAYDNFVNASHFKFLQGIVKSLIFTDENSFVWGTNVVTSLDGTKILKFVDTTATSYKIPDGVTEIGEYAFYGLTSLTSIDLNQTVNIGDYAFSASGLSGTLTIPSTVQVIGAGAFSNSKISAIVIQDAAVRIGGYAFENLPLTSLDLGNAVLSLGVRFLNSENSPYNTVIDTLIVPASVKGMDYETFACVRINQIYFAFSEAYAEQRMDETDYGGTPDEDGFVWDEWYLDYVDDIYSVDYSFDYNPDGD